MRKKLMIAFLVLAMTAIFLLGGASILLRGKMHGSPSHWLTHVFGHQKQANVEQRQPVAVPPPKSTAPPVAPAVANDWPPTQAPLSGIFLPAPAVVTNDPCGAGITAQIGETPDAPPAPTNYYNNDDEEGEYNYSPPPPPIPKPKTLPVAKTCEGGAIKIEVTTPQHFGYRLGMRIPITMEVTASRESMFDFSSLNSGVLAFDGSDFEMTDDPIRIYQTIVKDKKVWQVKFFVQTWVPKHTLVLNADLRYALKMSSDGHTPAWQVLTTPDLIITTNQTLDGGQTLQDGDMSQAVPQKQKLAMPLIIIGIAIFLFFPVRALVRKLYRLTVRVRKLSPEESAWITFDRLIAVGSQSGFDQNACREIAVTLRQYFKVESALRSEIERVLPTTDQRVPILQRALSACERTYAGSTMLPPQEGTQLVSDLHALIPRVWHDQHREK